MASDPIEHAQKNLREWLPFPQELKTLLGKSTGKQNLRVRDWLPQYKWDYKMPAAIPAKPAMTETEEVQETINTAAEVTKLGQNSSFTCYTINRVNMLEQ